MSEREYKRVGKISHYFSRISVAVAELNDTLSLGDTILIQGSTSNTEQTVESMQIEHENVQIANKGQSIGLKVEDRVREGDIIYKIIE